MTTVTDSGALVEMVCDLLDGLASAAVDLGDDNAAVEEALRLRAAHDRIKAALYQVRYCADRALIRLLNVGESADLDGVGQAIHECIGKQRTKGRNLARELASRIADTPCNADGEPLPPGALAELVADELVAVFGLDTATATFRSSEVAKRGLKPGAYRFYTDGEPSIRFEATA